MFKIIWQVLRKPLRIYFMQRKVFTGDYAENLVAIKRFMAERNNIMILHYESEDIRFQPVVDESMDEEMQKLVIDSQKKEFKEKLIKQKISTLVYAENNWLTRKLGFRRTKTHFMFTSSMKRIYHPPPSAVPKALGSINLTK